MGAVLGAVSPAVVVPKMVQLMEGGYGTRKSIPQMILAGASCDDIFAIVLFTTFLSMVQGGSVHMGDFLNIPVSIVLGIALGALVGLGLSRFFEWACARRQPVRNSMKVIVVLGVSFLLMAVEEWAKATVQAAIGSVPLAMGLPCGQLILSTAVLAILITAPLGSLGMELTYGKFLSREMP